MITEWLDRRLPELLEEHGVVGAQVGVLADGKILVVAAGVLNNVTGAPVTTDSIFALNSIGKVWTATLVLQLVNEGLLDLDRPVRDVLPDFRLADEEAARIVTPRQLLHHTGGFTGDHYAEAGSGPDDTIAAYVEQLAGFEQLTAPGEVHAYSNAGYVVLGRIVEVLRGRPFDDVLRERLLERSAGPVADGHLSQDGALKPVGKPSRRWDTPAGRLIAMSARDVLAFVRTHLETPEFAVMREPQVALVHGGGRHRGLGWAVQQHDNGVTTVGHPGDGIGFQSDLVVVPEAGVAVTVLTNGGNASLLISEVVGHVLGELAGLPPQKLPVPPATPVAVDAGKVAGAYRSGHFDVHVTPAHDGRVNVRYEPRNWRAEGLIDVFEAEYTGLREDALIGVEPEDGRHLVIVLGGDDGAGRFRWLHHGRLAVRL